jgi:hypothetical protein
MQCHFCSTHLGSGHEVRITLKDELKEMIEETFGEEIKSYKVM